MNNGNMINKHSAFLPLDNGVDVKNDLIKIRILATNPRDTKTPSEVPVHPLRLLR
jgi:hypothetical protein